MATEKFYVNDEHQKIDFYHTIESQICLRFWNVFECDYSIDLDLETIEEFVLDLQSEIQKIKSKGGKNG
jgi:hypothetical protein